MLFKLTYKLAGHTIQRHNILLNRKRAGYIFYIIKNAAAKRAEHERVIVIKSTAKGDAPFLKKVKSMNVLLAKASLFS